MGMFDKAKDAAESAKDLAAEHSDKVKDLAEQHGDKLPGGLGDKVAGLADKLPNADKEGEASDGE